MVPKGVLQYRGILLLLQHFNWKWIGFITAEEFILEWFTQNMLPEFSRRDISFTVLESFTRVYGDIERGDFMDNIVKEFHKFINSNINVFVFCGDAHTMTALKSVLPIVMNGAMVQPKGKVWILILGMEIKHISRQMSRAPQDFHGSISFSLPSKELQGFQPFLGSRNPSNAHDDGFVKDLWIRAFNCTFPDSVEGDRSQSACTGEEKLESFPNHIFPKSASWQSYSIYSAVYAVAYALHSMYSPTLLKRERKRPLKVQAWKVMNSTV